MSTSLPEGRTLVAASLTAAMVAVLLSALVLPRLLFADTISAASPASAEQIRRFEVQLARPKIWLPPYHVQIRSAEEFRPGLYGGRGEAVVRTLFGIPWAYPQSYDWNHRRVALAWLLFVGAEAALGWALIRTLEEW